MSTPPLHDDPPPLDPVAGVLAVLLPGAGHFYQGHRRRAALIAAGVLGLFLGGLLIGGIDVVDSRQDRLWFLGQVLVGPVALGADYIHQNRFKALDPGTKQLRGPQPGEVIDPSTGEWTPGPSGARAPMSKSLGKMNEIGTLYCTIAGMLNLIVIIDAAFPSRRRARPGGAA